MRALKPRKKFSAEISMAVFDDLEPDARELVRKWGRKAQDRITALSMSPAEAEADLRRKYGEAVRT